MVIEFGSFFLNHHKDLISEEAFISINHFSFFKLFVKEFIHTGLKVHVRSSSNL